jgi:hypothetical protein
MTIPNGYATTQALELVKTALGSGVIKLKGVDKTDHAASNGTADAEYLVALIKGLAEALPGV